MARVHTGNVNSSLPPDLRTTLDHEDEQFRNQDFYRKARVAPNARGGGGGGRGGGRGGRGGEHIRCCFACGLPGHFARDCPTHTYHQRNHVRRVNQAYGNGVPSQADVVDVSIGNDKFITKPVNISTFSESGKPVFDPISSNNVEIIKSLLVKIEQKEKELELYSQENEGLKSRIIESASEISSARSEKEELIKKTKHLEEQLEASNKSLSSAKEREAKMNSKWFSMTDELQDTINYLNKKVTEAEEANEAAEAEMKKMKLEAEQWRKAAKAAMAVLAGGAEICSKTPELEALVLYYSNRAAKRMSKGKMRKAIDDCRMTTRLDPNFLKVCLTAGNCHLLLGEVDDALYNFNKCLESKMVCLDRRFTIEASDGLQSAQKLVSYINQSAELLEQKTFESATMAMEVITDALSIGCYSEQLHEMKGEALFMLRKYEEVIQMCEQNPDFAEKNFSMVGVGNEKKPLKLWRWSLMSRSYFHLGRLEMALSIIEKQEQLTSTEAKTDRSFITLAATIRELLHCKSAGNEAYKGGRHREALEHYSNALLKSIQSRPFTAVCLCNRAAAHQALGEVIDAIADCNLAIALNGAYIKAISRRANLHEKIRDYEHAALDLRRLISLLENQCEEKSTKLTGGSMADLRVARQRLSLVERNTKRGLPLNLYLILGLKGSDSSSEIKKAYHKAALRHHPDKAGKFLARSGSGDDGQIWKEIVTTVHNDADRLFKMIGQAYAVLSDSNKKFRYDLEDSDED